MPSPKLITFIHILVQASKYKEVYRRKNKKSQIKHYFTNGKKKTIYIYIG